MFGFDGAIARGHGQMRHFDLGQTLGALALGAEKMDVAHMAMGGAVANTVFAHARAVVDFVQELLRGQQTERAENAAAVHIGQPALDVFEREGLCALGQGGPHHDAHRGGAHLVFDELLLDGLVVHRAWRLRLQR